jgi:hypothetical protein
MRQHWMRVFAVCAVASALLAASKPDFTGTWELAVDQSDFGNSTRPTRMTLVSSDKGDVMHSVTTTYTGQDVERIESDWYLDGKKHATDKPALGFSITRWEDNTLVNERQSHDGLYRQTIRLTLSVDGKTATEKVESKTPNGTNRTKLVWRKQS